MAAKLDIAQQLRRAIKDAIKPKDASLFKLGAKAGVNPAIISRFISDDEDERRDIRLETAAKLAAHLGMRLVVEKRAPS